MWGAKEDQINKVVQVALGVCLGGFALLCGLGVIMRGATETMSARISGVCFDAPDQSYGGEGSSDGDAYVMSFSNGNGVNLWIRIGPDLPLDHAAIERARARPGVFLPIADDPDELIAVEPLPSARIAHVRIEGATGTERTRILSGLRLCPDDRMKPAVAAE